MSGSIIFTIEKGDTAARHLLFGNYSTHGCVVGQQPLGPKGGHCFRHIDGKIVFTASSKGGKDVSDAIVQLIPRAQQIIDAVEGPIEVYFAWKAMHRPVTYRVEWQVPFTDEWHQFFGEDTTSFLQAHAARKILMQQAELYSANRPRSAVSLTL
jgi:hypothetical protein